jgi:OmpA-OmpF porin, OOP family
MFSTRKAHLAQIAVIIGAALLSSEARAVEPYGTIALNPLEPPPAGDGFVGVPAPFIGGHLVPRGQVLFDYANEPLTVDSGSTSSAVVGAQAFLHLKASLALWDRLLVSVNFPIAVAQSGDSPQVGSVVLDSPSSAGVGDLRFGVRVRIVNDEDDLFQLALGTYLHVPTGPSNAYLGDGAVRITPQLLLGGRIDIFEWNLAFGVAASDSQNPAALNSGFGAAVRLLDKRLHVGAEVIATTLLQEAPFQITERRAIPRDLLSTNMEVLGHAQIRFLGDMCTGFAAGPGLTEALGTPSYRILGTIGWNPTGRAEEAGPADTDSDGLRDPEDRCPYAWGPASADPKQTGCPVHDQDEDGVTDSADACPDRSGVASADSAKNGCPPPAPAESEPKP